MKNHRGMATTLILALALLGATTELAHAYLDPGTGSFFLQMLIGAIAGGFVTIKLYWTKLKLLFSGRRGAGERSKGVSS